MTTSLRLGLLAALTGLLLFGVLVLGRVLFGLDLGLTALAELSRVKERGRGLDRTNRALQLRIASKLRVTDEVAAGRLTLRQAAALFRRIHEETWDEFNCLGEKSLEDLSDRVL